MPPDDHPLDTLRDALALSPDNVPLRQALADALMSRGLAAEAEAEYRTALQANLVGTAVGLALLCAVAGFSFALAGSGSSGATLLVAAMAFLGLAFPLTAIYSCPAGWPRKIMIAVAAWCVLMAVLAQPVHFAWGVVAAMWLPAFLSSRTVTR